MSEEPQGQAAALSEARRLFVYNGGFLTNRRVRRILELSGWKISLGRPKDGDWIGIWGDSPTASRGLAMAERTNAPILRVEDTLMRSLFPGRTGALPMGLLLDQRRAHFDPSGPSDLETLLATHPFDDTVLLNRARGAIERMKEAHLTKYTAFDAQREAPEPGYVLVIDQTRNDASVRASKADRNRFLEMLFVAQEENPGARILIKTHPETQQGLREGHFSAEDTRDHVTLYDSPVSPWRLLEGAVAVYTISSGMGFEAILAGHKPRVFGHPFYAGWGLTDEENPLPRRQRTLTRAQLFAGAMILYPKWYDPFTDSLCTLETALENLAAETRAWREDHKGWVASGMRLWKRPFLQKTFGAHRRLRFHEAPGVQQQADRAWMVWAGRATADHAGATRVEDGFLRSQGLGAALVPPVSLVLDDLGIYYDPSRPSRLEELIRSRRTLRPDQSLRADNLRRALIKSGLSKYNLGGSHPPLPEGHRVLVVGQVEDDASMRLGAGAICKNDALLETARQARPDACLIYRPHPDVTAGLRPGASDATLADLTLPDADIAALLTDVDEVWTMTSLTGFEALLRGVPVVTTGAPFYAGWGLTEDLGTIPGRRREDVSLNGLIHATLIDYPRYIDPLTGAPCSVETVTQRLKSGQMRGAPTSLRVLSKAQGVFATYAHLWRR